MTMNNELPRLFERVGKSLFVNLSLQSPVKEIGHSSEDLVKSGFDFTVYLSC
jgi:hypothetical protein